MQRVTGNNAPHRFFLLCIHHAGRRAATARSAPAAKKRIAIGSVESPGPVVGRRLATVGTGDDTVAGDVLDGVGVMVVTDGASVVVVVIAGSVDVVVLVESGTLDVVLVEVAGSEDVDVLAATVVVGARLVTTVDEVPGMLVDEVLVDVVLVVLVLVLVLVLVVVDGVFPLQT